MLDFESDLTWSAFVFSIKWEGMSLLLFEADFWFIL